LRDVFERVKLKEVLAYTAAGNVRSQAVIAQLNMRRAATLDYSEPLGKGAWHGLVWMVRRDDLLDLDHSNDCGR
jgi:RimJ/RimL family protein N-acetyltransferase